MSDVPATGTALPPPAAATGRVVLSPREERRVLRGHRWIFSNEIAQVEGDPPGGSVVEVARQDGRLIGLGHYNPHSLIAVRLLTNQKEPIDEAFLVGRVRRALRLRQRLYPDAASYRLVHGESDDLSGLVVDRYEDCLAIQTLSLGMDLLKDTICGALEEVLKPRCIVERNESMLRDREGLPSRTGVLRGDAPETVLVKEADLQFAVRLLGGHKTGFYFDQRENRQSMRRFAAGTRALDAYCHDGAFALHLARAGAAEVLGLDIAEEAVEAATGNAGLNGLQDRCRFEAQDVTLALDALHRRSERFDLVVLDPPSFTRSRKNVAAAKRGYEEVNRKALRVLRRGGILATSSCSFHITDETFLDCIQEAAIRTERSLKLLEWRSQAPDHPILPAMPETRYLKFGIFEAD